MVSNPPAPFAPHAQLAPVQVCHLHYHLLVAHQFPHFHFGLV